MQWHRYYCVPLNVFDKSHPSKRLSDGECSLFTPNSRRASTTRQNRLKIAETCNNPFVLVNEDKISELMGGGGGVNAESTKRQIR